MDSKIVIFQHTQTSYSEEVFARLGRGKQHAQIVYSQWFRKGNLDEVFDLIESQAFKLVEKMIALTDFDLPTLVREKGEGETLKFLLKFSDGMESESVLIPMGSGVTICISSQIGCKMGCAFCETGRMGLIRHLTAQEIVVQVFYARFTLKRPIRNIVFMGMGEPLDNYAQVVQAIKILTDPAGLKFGSSRITVSTSGLVPQIYQLIEDVDPALNLAVSVNAPNDDIRNKIMPVNRQWNMAELKAAMQAYCAHPRREILIEYVLLKGINDSLEDADQLGSYLEGLRVKVNLIPYNSQTRQRFSPPDEGQKEVFLKRMRALGYQTQMRVTKGEKMMAACGQLGNLNLRKLLLNCP